MKTPYGLRKYIDYIPLDDKVALGNITEMFPVPLDMRDLPNGKRLIIEPFKCIDEKLGLEFTVPAGFVSDLASIPDWMTSIFHKIGDHDKAAVGHDYLYVSQICSKKRADMFFLHGMLDQGQKEWRSRAMYLGVVVGGNKSWSKHEERLKRLANV